MTAQEEWLRRIAIHDPACVEDALRGGSAATTLDSRTRSLVRLAALLAVEAPEASLSWGVSEAIAAGATPGDVTGVLLAVGPSIGSARLVAEAPRLGRALGWDIDAALEELDQPADRT